MVGQSIVGHVTHKAADKVQPPPIEFRALSLISPAWQCQLLSRTTRLLRPHRSLNTIKSLIQPRQDAGGANDSVSQAQRSTYAVQYALRCAAPLGRLL